MAKAKPVDVAPLEPMLTYGEVAALLKLSTRAVRTLVEQGKFPKPIHIGFTVRFRHSDVARIVNPPDPEASPARFGRRCETGWPRQRIGIPHD